MMSKRKLRVLLTGGGTGGHIYPALAVADRLKMLRPEVEFLYVGTCLLYTSEPTRLM